MTIQEMKKLIVGDVVQDLELYKNTGNVIYCVITKIYDDSVIAIPLKKEDEGHYPHSFSFTEYDCIKLGEIKYNLFQYMWENKIKSIEAMKNMVIK